MKKISMILFAVAMTVSFAACGGSKTNEGETPEATTDEVKTEEVAPAAEAANDADAFIANYEKFLNEMLPVMEKVSKGDAAATQEYAKFAEQAQQLAADAQKYVPNFTPEQTQKWTEMATKYAEAVQKMQPK